MTDFKLTTSCIKKTAVTFALAVGLLSSFTMPAMARDHDDHGYRGDRGHHYGWERRHAPQYRGIDDRNWRQGRWLHTRYNGRSGWWWVVGSNWRYYDAPVYPYPVNPYVSEVVYAPPVVVAPPPAPSPGINFVFPLHFD